MIMYINSNIIKKYTGDLDFGTGMQLKKSLMLINS